MEKQQIEDALIILKYHETISNITDEFRNRIPEKHLNQFEDLLLELDFISNKFSALEKNLYLRYLDNRIKEIENENENIITSITEHIIGDMVNKILEKE